MPTDIIEMFWGCVTCHAENKGRHKTCQECGKPRMPDCPEWMPDDVSPMAAIRDAALLKKFKAGEDWKCKYCGSSQFRADGNCAQCGSDQSSSEGGALVNRAYQKYVVEDEAKASDERINELAKKHLTPSTRSKHDMFESIAKAVSFTSAVAALPPKQECSSSDEEFMDDGSYRKAPTRKKVAPARVADGTGEDLDDVEADFYKIDRFKWRAPTWSYFAAGGAVVMTLILWLIFRTRDVEARVDAVDWHYTIHVDRYSTYNHDGWSPPGAAIEVHNLGPRIHHYDHVRVGSHTEHYTAREACGQSCSTPPCYTTSRHCTSNKNGSATCTGGNRVCPSQTCTTKYCDVPKTRTVDDYEDQPRYRDYYSWRVWEWQHNRDVPTTGTTIETSWATDDQVHIGLGLRGEEQERIAGRDEKYHVHLTAPGESLDYEPKSLQEFKRFAPNSPHKLRVGIAHGVEVLQ